MIIRGQKELEVVLINCVKIELKYYIRTKNKTHALFRICGYGVKYILKTLGC